jgi:hypothetical protein
MQHGAHSASDTMLLLGIFVIFLIMFIGGFFLIWRPLRSGSQTQAPAPEPEDSDAGPAG